MGEKDQSKNTEKEEKLLQLIRELKFGEVHIYVADGQPVRAEEIKKSVKFILNIVQYRLNNSRSYFHHVVRVEYGPVFYLSAQT